MINIVNNIFQVDSLSGPGVSMSKVLLIFYLLIANNFTGNLVSKQFKRYFQENRLAQHMIALLSLLVLITSVGGVVDTKTAVIYTVVGYIWFLFTTKLDIHWNMVIVMILLAGYLLENSLSNRERMMKNDKALSDKNREDIVARDNKMKMLIVGGAMIITILGTFLYSNKKHVQYGGGYDPITYLLY